MTETMLCKMARAYGAKVRADYLITGGGGEDVYSALKAALLAIREPSEAITDAGGDAVALAREYFPASGVAERTFTAMIDAILSEGEGQ